MYVYGSRSRPSIPDSGIIRIFENKTETKCIYFRMFFLSKNADVFYILLFIETLTRFTATILVIFTFIFLTVLFPSLTSYVDSDPVKLCKPRSATLLGNTYELWSYIIVLIFVFVCSGMQKCVLGWCLPKGMADFPNWVQIFN